MEGIRREGKGTNRLLMVGRKMFSSKIRYNKKISYFIIGGILLIKLFLMGTFSSDYQDKMFIPFVSTFLSGKNPYTYYYENDLLPSFPYLPLMLLIESIGGIILKFFDPTVLFLKNMLFKLPLLGADIVGYVVLRKMNIRFKYVTLFYFCSPIILYGTYMHGQLDIIPTVLLLVAIYYLTKWKQDNNLFFFSLFLGFAISTKFHIVAAIPILFFYIASKRGYLISIKYILYSTLVVAAFCVAFWSTGLINTVFLNKEQSVLLTVSLDYGSTQILIPILALLIIYGKAFELNYFNKNLLFSILGLLYAVFLICIPPMPAWFTWIVPFLALYFGYISKDKYKVMVIYASFNLLYIFYFVFLHKTDYVDIYYLGKSLQFLKISNNEIKYLVFTAMTACLGIMVYKIYTFGIASNKLYVRGNIPFVIGIAGDSGAGKSKLLEKIEQLFGSDKDILFIEGDGDHRWARNDEHWEKYTALDPKANYLYRQANDIHALRNGNCVNRFEYNHDTGTFTETLKIRSKKYIVLCGLHSLYLPQLRKELDLKIFMDTDNELRNFWKIQRDVLHRGYTKEAIVAQINKRLPDAEKYIYPQKQYADIIITYFDKTLKSCYEDEHSLELSVKFELDMNIDLEGITSYFRKYSIHPVHKIHGDMRRQEIVFDGKELQNNTIDFSEIARGVIPQYEDLFTYKIKWGEEVEGVVQIFLLVMISFKMRGMQN